MHLLDITSINIIIIIGAAGIILSSLLLSSTGGKSGLPILVRA